MVKLALHFLVPPSAKRQFVLPDGKHATMRSEPQLSVAIIENLADDVVG
jgi:hypothetical protein